MKHQINIDKTAIPFAFLKRWSQVRLLPGALFFGVFERHRLCTGPSGVHTSDRGRYKNGTGWAARCGCGREFSPDEWAALPLVGRMEDEPDETIELRNCPCGSTISVPVPEGSLPLCLGRKK